MESFFRSYNLLYIIKSIQLLDVLHRIAAMQKPTCCVLKGKSADLISYDYQAGRQYVIPAYGFIVIQKYKNNYIRIVLKCY